MPTVDALQRPRTFAPLGPAVFDAQGQISPDVRFADLDRHVWFTETRVPMAEAPSGPVLGTHDGRAVALLCNGTLKDRSPGGGNVLTHPDLKLIPEDLPRLAAEHDGALVVYGAACRLSESFWLPTVSGEFYPDLVARLTDGRISCSKTTERSTFAEPMYRPRGTPVGDPKARGAQLVPSLNIPDRDHLSDHYINSVLRPYAQAEIALRKRFFQSIRTSHKNFEWIGFRPIPDGCFVPLHPSAGFDGKGGYAIDRATYLDGFGSSEDEIGTENFPHRKPYEDQERWIFLVAEQGASFTSSSLKEIHPDARPGSKRVGRPKGTGYDNQDAPFVAKGVQLIKDPQALPQMETGQ